MLIGNKTLTVAVGGLPSDRGQVCGSADKPKYTQSDIFATKSSWQFFFFVISYHNNHWKLNINHSKVQILGSLC